MTLTLCSVHACEWDLQYNMGNWIAVHKLEAANRIAKHVVTIVIKTFHSSMKSEFFARSLTLTWISFHFFATYIIRLTACSLALTVDDFIIHTCTYYSHITFLNTWKTFLMSLFQSLLHRKKLKALNALWKYISYFFLFRTAFLSEKFIYFISIPTKYLSYRIK